MPEFFSSDGNVILQFLAIFSVIVVVMGGLYLIYRRFSGRGLSLSARAGNRSRQPRLGIVDIYELDRQRQLILLRRDNVEHLLLVGGPNDVVVERNVQRGAGARVPSDGLVRPDPASDTVADAAPGQRPPFPPTFEMPVVVSQPLPGSDRQPDAGAPPLDASLFEPEPAEPKPGEAQTARGRAGRILRRTPPPLVNPRPDAAARPQTAPGPPPDSSDAVPPTMPPGATRSVDPAVLSDMARQLEVALRRPSSAVTPPPGQAAAAADRPQAEPAPAAPPLPTASEATSRPTPEPPRVPNPVAAGMAASQALNPSQARPKPQAEPAPPAPGTTTSQPETAPAPAPAPAPADAAAPPSAVPPPPLPPQKPEAVAPPPPPAPTQPKPPPTADAKSASVPEPEPAEPTPDAVPSAEARPEQPAAKPEVPNPFSVEEIEAEFARLLGRPLDKKD